MEKKDQKKIGKQLKRVPEELKELDVQEIEKWKKLIEIRELDKPFYRKPMQLLQIIIPLFILGLTWIIKGGAIKEYLDVERIKLERDRIELAYEKDSLEVETQMKEEKLAEKENQLSLAEDSLQLKKSELSKTERQIKADKMSLDQVEKSLKEKEAELLLAEADFNRKRQQIDTEFAKYQDEVRSDSIELNKQLAVLQREYENKRVSTDSLSKLQTSLVDLSIPDMGFDSLSYFLDQYYLGYISLTKAKLNNESVQIDKLTVLYNQVVAKARELASGSLDLGRYGLLHEQIKALLGERRTNKGWGRRASEQLENTAQFITSTKASKWSKLNQVGMTDY